MPRQQTSRVRNGCRHQRVASLLDSGLATAKSVTVVARGGLQLDCAVACAAGPRGGSGEARHRPPRLFRSIRSSCVRW